MVDDETTAQTLTAAVDKAIKRCLANGELFEVVLPDGQVIYVKTAEAARRAREDPAWLVEELAKNELAT
jgi:hypothetical protein